VETATLQSGARPRWWWWGYSVVYRTKNTFCCVSDSERSPRRPLPAVLLYFIVFHCACASHGRQRRESEGSEEMGIWKRSASKRNHGTLWTNSMSRVNDEPRLGGVVVSALGMRTRRPRSRHYSTGQVVYIHCLPSFSAPRNWGTKGSFRRLSGYGD